MHQSTNYYLINPENETENARRYENRLPNDLQ